MGLFLGLVYRMPVNGDISLGGGGGGGKEEISVIFFFCVRGALDIPDIFGIGLSLRIKKNESTTPSLEVNGRSRLRRWGGGWITIAHVNLLDFLTVNKICILCPVFSKGGPAFSRGGGGGWSNCLFL